MGTSARTQRSDEQIHTSDFEVPTGIPLDGDAGLDESTGSLVRRNGSARGVRAASRKSSKAARPATAKRSSVFGAKKAVAKKSAKVGKKSKPSRLSIRTYQVGFGDCFLLTFKYPGGSARHVLIDYGSTSAPKGIDSKKHMLQVADDIVTHVGTDPFAVVATHRHRDHISGFTTAKNGKGTGDKIRGCKPKVVIQPWTEDPDVAPKGTKPPTSTKIKLRARGFAAALADMHMVAAAAVEEAKRLEFLRAPKGLVKELGFLGQNNLKNASAVKNLMTMGAKQRYVFFGSKSGLEEFLPGVKTHVLGPPTLEQSDTISSQRSKDPDEFWHLQAQAQRYAINAAAERFDSSASSEGSELFPDAPRLDSEPPPFARWFVPRVRALRAEQMLEIVRSLDDALNNTSVILLFEAGKKKFLFPGDAQIENWQFALSKPKVRALLRDVDFYKVGHHGSLNATPKSLWKLFDRKSLTENAPDRLRTAVSTMPGKHGARSRGTEVPRSKLVDALKKSSEFTTTQSLKKSELFKEFIYELK